MMLNIQLCICIALSYILYINLKNILKVKILNSQYYYFLQYFDQINAAFYKSTKHTMNFWMAVYI